METKGHENAEEISEEERAEAERQRLEQEILRQKALKREILRQGLLKSELEYEEARAVSKRLERERKRRKVGKVLVALGAGSFMLFFFLLGFFENIVGYILGLLPIACIAVGASIWSWNRPN